MPTQEQTESAAPNDSAGAIQSAAELQDGDRVVYPKQGVCRVTGRQAKEIAGQRLEFIALAREEDNASILVPVAKVPTIGLRKVADNTELGDVFDLLASSFDDPELDWKVRHRLHGDLLSAGGILGVAEVLKALQALANLRPLPQKERERYDAARHLLVDEVAVALGVPAATAEDFIDLALIPPPGVVRPAAKPRRLATLPPRPQRPATRPRPRMAGDEEILGDDLGLDEELGEDLEFGAEEEQEAPEEAAEGAAEGEAEEEEAPAARPRKAAAKKPAEKKEKKAPAEKPAAKKASRATAARTTTARVKKAEGEEAPEKPRRAPAKKAAAEGEAATRAPARKSTRSRKSE